MLLTRLTSPQQRLFKTGRRLIRHARYFILQLAESHLTQRLFGQILGHIERLAWSRPEPASHTGSERNEQREGDAAAVSLEDMVAAIKLGGNGSHRP
jgi:hypothetical protein